MMFDAAALADLGRASAEAVWVPIGLWTALAVVVEAVLRLGRSPASLALPVRGALLAALPLGLAVPAVVSALPRSAAAVARWEPPAVQWLPEVWVGGSAPAAPVASAPPLDEVMLGLAVIAGAVMAIVGLLRLARSLAEVRAVRRRLPPADADAQQVIDVARHRLQVTRSVQAVVAPLGVAPFTLGVCRPIVALPPDLGDAAREVAAAHEVAHVRRADYGWHLAQRVVTAVFAAHPLAWALGRAMNLDRERAADALVLNAFPGRRRTYADLLFSYAAVPAPPLALGAVGGSSSLKTRIDAMTSPLSPLRTRQLARWGRLGGALALVLATGLAATVATPPGDPFSWSLDRVIVDGTPRVVSNGFTSLTADRFDNLVLVVEPEGQFVISDRPFTGAQNAGQFDGQTLQFESGGHAVRIAAQAPYFDTNRTAYVRFEAPTTASARGPGRAAFAVALSLNRAPAAQTAAEMFALLSPGVARGERSAADTVEGRVTDADSNAPIPNASVSIPGTTVGAQTDADGRYRLNAPAGANTVRVVAPGYTSRLVRLADGQQQLDIALTTRDVASPGSEAVTVQGRALTRPSDAPRPDVFDSVEQMPELIGGVEALQAAVEYPRLAIEAGIEGRVIVQFIVDTDGSVTEAVAVRSPHDLLTQAALEAVQRLRFEPGRQAGEAVKVRFALPVMFRLPASDDTGSNQPRGSTSMSTGGLAVTTDTAYSDDLESMLDAITSMREFQRARLNSRVASGENPFQDLTPGTARVAFRVQDDGRPLIQSIDASTPAMERYGRLQALTTLFKPEAVGRAGTMTVEVTSVR